MIRAQEINEAYERLLKSDVKYRFVIDMLSSSSGVGRITRLEHHSAATILNLIDSSIGRFHPVRNGHVLFLIVPVGRTFSEARGA